MQSIRARVLLLLTEVALKEATSLQRYDQEPSVNRVVQSDVGMGYDHLTVHR